MFYVIIYLIHKMHSLHTQYLRPTIICIFSYSSINEFLYIPKKKFKKKKNMQIQRICMMTKL